MFALFGPRSSPTRSIYLRNDQGDTLHSPLVESDFIEHVSGGARYGAIPFVDALRVGWGCLDFDLTTKCGLDPDDPASHQLVGRVCAELRARGLRCGIERSKGKGYHVWLFFEEPVEAAAVRALLADVVRKTTSYPLESDTICPRQDRRDRAGNGTWLPLYGGDEAPHTRFVNPETFEPEADQVKVLRELIENPNPADLVRQLAAGLPLAPSAASKATGPAALVEGPIPEGQRNTTLASLAGTMRRPGMSPEAIEAALLFENATRCEPPLPEAEVRRIARSIAKYEPEAPLVVSTPGDSNALRPAFPLNDLGNAARFARDHGARLKYVGAWKCWMSWDGTRWARAEYGVAEALGRETVRKMYEEASTIPHQEDRAKFLRHLADLESHRGFRAMMDLAKTQPGIPQSPTDFDADCHLFNVQNGTLDLRTIELRPHDPADFITKISPVVYDPTARSEEWERVVEAALPDPELRAYFARCVGYSLGGDLIHDALFFVYGPTGTMKSTTMGATESMMGDYARTTEFDTFLRRNDVGGTRPGLAKLPGVRMALCAEVEPRRALHVGLVKAFTGGDLVECHGKYQDPFTFRPQARLWLMANDLPRIPHEDEAMWRRLKVLPFLTQVTAYDEGLKLRLRDPVRNGAAILNWALRGRADWEARERKLDEPPQVTVAGDGYRDAMDTVSSFIDDRCECDPKAFETSSRLLEAYDRWALERRLDTTNAKALGSRLKALGYEPVSTGSARGWRGLRLLPLQPD